MQLQNYLDLTAKRFPEKIAVTDGRSSITFENLAVFSEHVGGLLCELGVTRGERVVYFMKRSPDCITASMGILKSGAAYIPLDMKTPPERWRRIVEDSAPKAFLCHAATLPETLARTKEMRLHCPIICLSPCNGWGRFENNVYFLEEVMSSSGVVPSGGCPDDVAHVLYTSGSTGTPKGVMITHDNVRDYIEWGIKYFQIAPEDHILGTAPFYFDMSTFDIFCALFSGATLSLATEELLLFPEKLVKFMEAEEVTLWKGVSSLLMYMSRASVLRPGRMPSLHTVIFAGEPLAPQYLSHWMQTFPQKKFYNGYGPTEATGVSLCHHVKNIPQSGPIPIGRPCKNAKAVVIDDDGVPVTHGEIGELCIAGPSLAKGYLNDPAKTNKNFTPPPPNCPELGERIYHTGDLVRQNEDGDFIFISRKDHQVKWMGYRIELAEIEANLVTHPQVRDAVALLSGPEADLPELLAFFEADTEVDSANLLKFLESKIPHYMIPRQFIRMDSLPRNDRGKIARDALLEHYSIIREKNHAAAY
ncbi:MAG: amino acid adenylation domain-containing protein [Anaerolineales bacterium]|nr:amino acid adenylation domain-containing protein [Anaerolineales bacterium]